MSFKRKKTFFMISALLIVFAAVSCSDKKKLTGDSMTTVNYLKYLKEGKVINDRITGDAKKRIQAVKKSIKKEAEKKAEIAKILKKTKARKSKELKDLAAKSPYNFTGKDYAKKSQFAIHLMMIGLEQGMKTKDGKVLEEGVKKAVAFSKSMCETLGMKWIEKDNKCVKKKKK